MDRLLLPRKRRARWRRISRAAITALGLWPLAQQARAADDAIWIGLAGNTSWINAANWDTNIAPNGTLDVARFNGQSGGAIVQLGGSSITLSTLELNDPLFTSLTSGTINLVGAAIVNADGANFDLPDKVFPSFGNSVTLPGNNIGGAGSLAATFVGSNGLNKTGDSHLQIDSQQYYGGTTSITGGGKIITTIGDGAFGIIGNAINLNNGSIQVANTNWTTSRTINVGSLGGSVYWVDTGRSVDFSGNFIGSGSLQLNGRYGNNVGAATIRTANSLSGTLNIGGGTVIFADSGAFLNVPNISNSGTLILDNTNASVNVDRIANLTPILMRGAALSLKSGGVNYSETMGSLSLAGGVSFISLDAGAGGAQLTTGNVLRSNSAGLVIRGNNLGQTPGANNSNVYFNNGTSLLIKGIIPFAYANGSFTASSTPENPDNLLVTYGANGVTPIIAYNPNFTGATTSTNVRVTANTTVTGNVFVNSLVIAAPANLQVGAGTAGVLLGSAAGVLNVDSGVILSANAGFQTAGSGSILNSLPGNIINSDIEFGAREGILLTPSALKITGSIDGTGGLTKLGARTLELTGQSTYTGTTILTGFNRFSGNVFGDGFTPTAFGLDTSPIILYGGNANPYNPTSNTTNGTGIGVLGANSAGAIHFDRAIDLRGDWVQLRDFGSGTVTWKGNLTTTDPNTLVMFLTSKSTGHQVLSGTLTGPAHVVIGAIDPNPGTVGDPEETWLDLLNQNAFNGGLIISGGTVGIGNDLALGGATISSQWVPGTVQFNGNGVITAINGPRTIPNKFVIYDTTLGIGGTNTIDLTGEINARGGDFIANVTNTANTTFSGSITGGGFYKQGTGTLIIKGNNTFTGVLNVGNGSIAGGMVILQSNTALGSTAGPSGVEAGNNTLGIDGVNLPGGGMVVGQELLYIRGSGVSNLGALRSMTGDNVWGGTIRPQAHYSGAGTSSPVVDVSFATIGVDAGSTLTVNGAIIADDPGVLNNVGSTLFLANSIGLRKVGTGNLVVGAHVVNSQVGNATFNWNGAIVTNGSLDIQQGVVSVKSQAGVPTIANGHSVVDVGSINIAGGTLSPSAQLDLADNAMVIDYAVTTPLTTVRAYLRDGYHNGAWDGNGITSSIAATSPNAGEVGRTSIGYAEALDLGISSFLNDPLDGAALVMRYTYAGDANLDGIVNASDLGLLGQHWQGTGSWYQGDFNYDGVVDVDDLYILATNWYAGTVNPLNSPSLGQALASADLPIISVPEPTFGVFCSVGTAGCLLGRRRRSRKNQT